MNFIVIDKNLETPLYLQIANAYIKAIDEWKLLPEQRLPSEEVLCRTFHISPNSVQMAYAHLESTGYIVRHPKGGTFVSRRSRYQFIMDAAPIFIRELEKNHYAWEYVKNLDETIGEQRNIIYTYFIENNPMIINFVTLPKDYNYEPKMEFVDRYQDILRKTVYKAIVIDKYEALFFNKTEAISVFEFTNTYFYQGQAVATLKQWVSPLLGDVIVEN
jgi:DNA-binding transcriptional regulator YhcF (GntR family)